MRSSSLTRGAAASGTSVLCPCGGSSLPPIHRGTPLGFPGPLRRPPKSACAMGTTKAPAYRAGALRTSGKSARGGVDRARVLVDRLGGVVERDGELVEGRLEGAPVATEPVGRRAHPDVLAIGGVTVEALDEALDLAGVGPKPFGEVAHPVGLAAPLTVWRHTVSFLNVRRCGVRAPARSITDQSD